MKYLIIGIILAYFIYVVCKKVNDVKKGKFCCGTCENCSEKCKGRELKK